MPVRQPRPSTAARHSSPAAEPGSAPNRPPAPLALALLATLCDVVLVSCANPGPLRPPSLNLPSVVTGLRVERVGGAVQLHWTTPALATDGPPVRGAMTAEICRSEPRASSAGTGQPGNHDAACTWSTRLAVAPGASAATDALPLALQQDAPRLLAYQVTLSNSSSRSAGRSQPVFAAAGAAPAPVAGLRVTARARGAAITWQSVHETDAVVELTRSAVTASGAVTPATDASAPTSAAPAGKFEQRSIKGSASKRGSASGKRRRSSPSTAGPSSPDGEVHLVAAPVGPDRGGTLDTSAPFGVALAYCAERVRTVTLAGHTLQLRSGPSAPVTATLRDTFPPAVPSGLLAADGTRPARDANPAQPAVDLSWEPGAESDLAGYLVERSVKPEFASGMPGSTPSDSEPRWQSLTPQPVQTPAFRDETARPGVLYRYRVLAVDGAGNRSAPGLPAAITLPASP